MKRKKIIILFIAIMLLCIVPINVKAASNKVKIDALDANGELEMNTDDIDINVSVGYKGRYKNGKAVRIDTIVDNKGDDFTGKFRIEYFNHSADGLIASQKIFAVAAGEKKKVQFSVAEISPDTYIRFTLCDENDKALCKKYINAKANNFSSQLYIGALSDDLDILKYISNELAADKTSLNADDEGYLFELESDDITDDAKMLEALDVIIIDNFDTSKLSKGQINAIKNWISEGGTLMLGSGANADKVLKAFSGNLLKGRIGSVKSIRTNFGVSRKELTRLLGENLPNKKIPLDITKLSIKDSKPVLTDGREKLISAVPYRKGNIIISEFSLSLESEASKLYGRLMVNTIKNNLSDDRKNYIGLNSPYTIDTSYSGSYGYDGDEALMLNNTDSLPNLKLYAVLLILYVLIAGPIIYMIMKKKDKRSLLWGIVPALSVIFSITIYLIGTSTRIQRPYINYISTIELSENANEQNKVNTKFSLTSSSNQSYETEVSGDTDISPVGANFGYYYSTSPEDIDTNNFDYGVEYGAKNTKLMMNNLAAFQSAYFMTNNKSSNTGGVEINVTKEDNKILGIINNKMSCNLEDCIFYNKGTIYYIGDFPAGKAFDISKTPKKDIYSERKYSFDFESQLSAALGGSFYDNGVSTDIKRKYAMIMNCIVNNQTSSSWFYGFVADGEEKGFTDTLEYNKYGETGVFKIANVTEKVDGLDVIGSLENYAYSYDGNETDGYYVYNSKNNEFNVQYKFPENFSIKKIIYNEETVGGGEYKLSNYGYAEEAFLGEAKVLDKDTGKYVTLIKSTHDTEIDDIEKYLEDDGNLIIYYDISYNQGDNVSSFVLPRVDLVGKYNRR